MALMCRRKALSFISRHRLCGRLPSFSSFTANSSSVPPPTSFWQTQSLKQIRPAMTALPSPLCEYAAFAFVAGKCTTQDAPFCFTHNCRSRCGCSCMKTSGLLSFTRNCTTTAYPPPTPPGEFQGGDEDPEADGAPLNVDEAAGEAGLPPEDFEMPPYDYNDAEDDGDFVDEDPPPDPEEALLFSPSDSD